MDDNRTKVILESFRQSEELLKSQLTVSLSSDGRALTFCGLTLTAASLLTGLAESSGFEVAMYAAGVILYVASAIAGINAMPVAWYAPGQKSGDFSEDVSTDRPYIEVVAEMAEQNDLYIARNEAIRTKQNQRLWVSACAATAAAPFGILIELGNRLI